MMLCVALLTGCTQCKKAEAPAPEEGNVAQTEVKGTTVNLSSPIVGVQFYDLEKVLTLDAQYVAAKYGPAKFYEATIILDQKINDVEGEAHPIYIKTVFQAGYKAIFCEHPTTPAGTDFITNYQEFDDFYLECMEMELPIKMTINQAIERLNQANTTKPASNVLVLRKPLMPPFGGPYYIAGTTKTGFISVNTETGDVHVLDTAKLDTVKLGTPLGEWP